MMTLYVVGQCRENTWEFQGVFDTEEAAIAACRTGKYFVGPIALNEALPDERANGWPGQFFPILSEEWTAMDDAALCSYLDKPEYAPMHRAIRKAISNA
jgi:hypothetical protein